MSVSMKTDNHEMKYTKSRICVEGVYISWSLEKFPHNELCICVFLFICLKWAFLDSYFCVLKFNLKYFFYLVYFKESCFLGKSFGTKYASFSNFLEAIYVFVHLLRKPFFNYLLEYIQQQERMADGLYIKYKTAV